jgi:hypothetical protein
MGAEDSGFFLAPKRFMATCEYGVSLAQRRPTTVGWRACLHREFAENNSSATHTSGAARVCGNVSVNK